MNPRRYPLSRFKQIRTTNKTSIKLNGISFFEGIIQTFVVQNRQCSQVFGVVSGSRRRKFLNINHFTKNWNSFCIAKVESLSPPLFNPVTENCYEHQKFSPTHFTSRCVTCRHDQLRPVGRLNSARYSEGS